MITRRTSFYEFISVGGFTIKSAHQRMYFLLQLSNGDENSEDNKGLLSKKKNTERKEEKYCTWPWKRCSEECLTHFFKHVLKIWQVQWITLKEVQTKHTEKIFHFSSNNKKCTLN